MWGFTPYDSNVLRLIVRQKNQVGKCKCICKCNLDWPLPIGAFQDQYKQTMINEFSNEHNEVKVPISSKFLFSHQILHFMQ